MTFELGVYTFGNTPRLADGRPGPTAQAVQDALEAIRLADEVGLDFFGVGEHHMRAMPLTSPTSLVNAAAATTNRITLSTAVSVLSTDDPIRVYQQLATAASIAPGRIEMVAGRGSSAITFPLFDYDENDYDMLYASKLQLLMAVNAGENLSWNGPHRTRALRNATVFPRPEQPLKIWLGTGGSPDSVYRAVELGLPMFLGILGGTPEHWAQYGHAYRHAWAQAGHPAEKADVAVAVHGFVADTDAQARSTYLDYEHRMMAEGMAELGRPAPPPGGRAADMKRGGMVFVGTPDEVADRILHLHGLLGHTRQILQMDVGGLPHRDFLHGIELLGTKVLPQIRAELGDTLIPRADQQSPSTTHQEGQL
ncbi:LLM class flavin-dependent oxidoreductase [Parafrankia sp. FMc6]|uniref:LLM class flavin-dependent oxidoreductase n=1 Tax=Parafrankia soli TaxID=2599596 RepID=UPI0034D4A517